PAGAPAVVASLQGRPAQRLLPPERLPELPGGRDGHPRPPPDRRRPDDVGLGLPSYREHVPAVPEAPRPGVCRGAGRGAAPHQAGQRGTAVRIRGPVSPSGSLDSRLARPAQSPVEAAGPRRPESPSRIVALGAGARGFLTRSGGADGDTQAPSD